MDDLVFIGLDLNPTNLERHSFHGLRLHTYTTTGDEISSLSFCSSPFAERPTTTTECFPVCHNKPPFLMTEYIFPTREK